LQRTPRGKLLKFKVLKKLTNAFIMPRARIDPSKLVGIGAAFPDDIRRAGLPEQPPEYALWGSETVDQLLSSVCRYGYLS
jgi:hypothetical protein